MRRWNEGSVHLTQQADVKSEWLVVSCEAMLATWLSQLCSESEKAGDLLKVCGTVF